MVTCEAEQKKQALLYIKTLQEFKQTGVRLWQENPPTHDPNDPSYFVPNESASHKFIDLEEQNEQKKKRKSQGKRKLKHRNSETPQKKKNKNNSAQEFTKPNQLQSTNNVPSHETPVTTEPPITPVTPGSPVPPLTPATPKGKGRGKGKGKTSTQKTPPVIMPNPNDYGPLVPDAIEKALLETEVLNIVMYNNRIQGCYYEKCCHKLDPMFMIPPNNMLFRMKTYRKYTRKSDGIQVKNTYKSNAYYCLETLECVHGVNKGSRKNHIYMSNFYFWSLTPGHVVILKELGCLDHILANYTHVTADGLKALGGMPAIYEY